MYVLCNGNVTCSSQFRIYSTSLKSLGEVEIGRLNKCLVEY